MLLFVRASNEALLRARVARAQDHMGAAPSYSHSIVAGGFELMS